MWRVGKTIMQVSVLVHVASSDAWNDYICIIRKHFLLSAYFVATESDSRMCLLTRVYGIHASMHTCIETEIFKEFQSNTNHNLMQAA